MNRVSPYLLPSITFLAISVAIGIRHSAFHILDYVYLKVFTYLGKSYLCSMVGQTRLSSIAIINIEGSKANYILQGLMD